jgi:uncharacterized protein YndB with AHSA1/START domain
MSVETLLEEHKVVLKRTYAAPVEKVYQAWTDPEKMVQWLSPNARFNAPTVDCELSPGGRHNLTMNHSDGDQFHMIGEYVEILPNERISFTWKNLEGPDGGNESLVTVEFRAVADGTELTLTHDRQANRNSVESTSGGWTGCLEMLESFLVGNPRIGMEPVVVG